VAGEFREAEIQHLHHAVRFDFDVSGLQIPMDDSFLVGSFQSIGNLTGDPQRFLQRNRSLLDALG
jgi:hypothetical protein